MRRTVLAVIVLIAVAAVIIALIPAGHFAQHHLVVRTSFADANDLRVGAPVMLAGVRIGRVRSVEVHPERKEAPADVVLDIWTDNEIEIPSDSIVTADRAGVLGETLAAIDVTGTSGPPIKSEGTLRSRTVERLTFEKVVKALQNSTGNAPTAVSKKPKEPSAPQQVR